MSNPRELWWGYVKRVLRAYPEYKRELAELRKNVSITPNYSANGGGSGISTPTETAALRELPPKEQERYDAVTKALTKTKRKPDGALRCRMIEKVYFQQSHTLPGAAALCHVSYDTAVNWNRDFIRLVAVELKLL